MRTNKFKFIVLEGGKPGRRHDRDRHMSLDSEDGLAAIGVWLIGAVVGAVGWCALWGVGWALSQ